MVDTIPMHEFITRYAEGVTLIDVREAPEYVDGHVPGAVFTPMSRIHQYLTEIPRDEHVYVICRSGNRSKTVAEFLDAQGFEVTSVNGGTQAWEISGQPVVAGRTPNGD